MFCRQKNFVCDRRPVFECRQRTQSFDAGVGDESAVVCQVTWGVAGQTSMNKRDDLVVDALAAALEASAAGDKHR